MNVLDKGHGGDAGPARADLEFVVDGATIKVAFDGTDAPRDPRSSLEKAKRAIARLALLHEAELARQRPDVAQARPKRPELGKVPNLFDHWAYRTD